MSRATLRNLRAQRAGSATVPPMQRPLAIAIGVALLGAGGLGTLALTNRSVAESLPDAPTVADASTILASCGQVNQDQKSGCLVAGSMTAFDAIGDLPSILTEVEQQVANNPDLRGVNCHGTFHEIGKLAYSKIGDDALTNGVPLCSGGYYHGVLQAGGNIDQARSLCGTLTDDAAQADCMHGAGHAIYLENPDLTNARAFCEGTKYDACLAGFFMELAGANQRDTRALAYCADPTLDEVTLGACYNGLLSDIAINHPDEVRAWCTDNAATPDRQPDTCWAELGSGLGSGVNERQPVDDKKAAREVTQTCEGNTPCLTAAAYVLRTFFQRGGAADTICAEAQGTSERYPDACRARGNE